MINNATSVTLGQLHSDLWLEQYAFKNSTFVFRVELGFCKVSNIREKQEARDLILNTQTYS